MPSLELRDHQSTLLIASIDRHGQATIEVSGARDFADLTVAQTDTLTNWLMEAKIKRETT